MVSFILLVFAICAFCFSGSILFEAIICLDVDIIIVTLLVCLGSVALATSVVWGMFA